MTPASDCSGKNVPSGLSVVVVNWNTAEHLETCLRALPAAAGDLQLEAIVVDNASTDDSVSRLEALAASSMPWLQILANDENMGFGAGAQQGLELCQGAWLAVLNPDVTPEPGSLAGLVRFLRAHPRGGLAGPAHHSPDNGRSAGGADPLPGVLSALADIPIFGRLYRRWRNRVRETSTPRRCGSVRGACLVFRRQALEDIGGFPRETFLYGEEILLGYRLRDRGYEVWYVPTWAVVHEHGASVKQRWPENEVVVERRRVRIQVLGAVLSRPAWLLWNALAWLGLSLQGLVGRLRSRPAPPWLTELRRLHGRSLAAGRPLEKGRFR